MKFTAFAILTTLLLATSSWVACEDTPDAGGAFTDSIDSSDLGEGGPEADTTGSADEIKGETDRTFDGAGRRHDSAPAVPVSTPTAKGEAKEDPLPDVVKIEVPAYENPAEGITEPIRRKEDIQPQKPKEWGWWKKWGAHSLGALLFVGAITGGALYGALGLGSIFWTLALGIGGYFSGRMLYDLVIKLSFSEGKEDANDKRTGWEKALPWIGLGLGATGGILLGALGVISIFGAIFATGLGALGGYFLGKTIGDTSYSLRQKEQLAQEN